MDPQNTVNQTTMETIKIYIFKIGQSDKSQLSGHLANLSEEYSDIFNTVLLKTAN